MPVPTIPTRSVTAYILPCRAIELAESVREALPPARVAQLPAEFALGLLVGRSPRLGHRDHGRLAGQQPGQPAGNVPRWLGPEGPREPRQPVPYRRRVVVDDVVDARLPVLDREGGRRRGVVDVDVRED